MGERKGTKGLELWCRKITEGYPGVKVTNMTTSWRDGLAFCAMIHHFRPDLIEFDKLNKDDVYHNNELAFRVAEHHLGIPALLEPEDMVEYLVPDRLSILTYLSQFYQAFANQRGKSGARMIAPKRPQSTPDHGIVSPASTSPPTKVQITIGRARREPCSKCGLPVFIAERLNVGKHLYHRTCFRCARCSSQLTMANYYETENGEFCCEICPDEEKKISKKVSPDSVLNRSLSDEEKIASLQTYSDAPDAYSTHFESALEFPLDGELKKSSTLTDTESTEFTRARSQFFNSQMEASSESGSEDIPVELPKTRPPPLIKGQFTNEDIPFDIPKPKPPLLAKPDNLRTEIVPRSDNSNFLSDTKDTVILRHSDSEQTQTNDRVVTKDNASSSSSRVSVRARMKLFENNEDSEDNKSDVNTFSSGSNQVPLTSVKKKATVVAIDDLEDFDNISKKDIDVENSSLKSNSSSINVHSDKVRNESDIIKPVTIDEKGDIPKESNVDLIKNNMFYAEAAILIKTNDLDVVQATKENESDDSPQSSNPDVIEIIDSSQEADVITIDNEEDSPLDNKIPRTELSCITIDDSPEGVNKEATTSKITISDDSFLSATSVISPATISSGDSVPHKRGYYTAYEIPSEDDSVLLDNEVSTKTNLTFESTNVTVASDREALPKEDIDILSFSSSETNEKISKVEEKIVPENETGVMKDNNERSSSPEPKEIPYEDENIDNAEEQEEVLEEQNHNDTSSKDIKVIEETSINLSKSNINELDISAVTPDRSINKANLDPIYPDDLNPFGDDEESVSLPQKSFGVSDDEKIAFSTRPVPVARPKKKIIPSLGEREFTGTPECLQRIYVERISRNPFEEEESEEEPANISYNPFEEDEEEPVVVKPKKKIVLSSEDRKRLGTAWTESPKSYNPFEDDEDDAEIEVPVKPVPVPTPRTSKASRPEAKPRDNLSITSRGSHGGSNSSISSGSAFGSTRKKKPAPRPPMPFITMDSPSKSGSSLTSPSSSVAPSPNMSGTLRSRKTKRAPLPPNASTPLQPERKDFADRLPIGHAISPINVNSTDEARTDKRPEKNVKDEENRNRQSQILNIPSNGTDSNLSDKSAAGRWKRRKGQAPSRPIPQRRMVTSLPISEIKRELDTIEIQQQGLEKQGVRLEQIIREKCEGPDEVNPEDQVPIEVEDLILQLFELVNEKNELFRRQAELMYLRRQQRLEEEHADVEYQIRCLEMMLQPEANKKEIDTLINRLVEIVERRNEIIECLEMDRKREADEDNSISSQLNLYSAKRDADKDPPQDDEKKGKKKKHKKLNKIIHTFKHKKEKDHKVDVDKDVDETEVNSSTEKGKKKKFNLF